jgi:uncharacterized Zn finger protein
MIEILKKICEANTEKSTIVLKGKCSDCGCKTIVNITSTAGGFGLQGGVLFKSSPDEYLVKCPDCYKVHPKIDDHYKPQNINVSLLDKTESRC